MSLLPHPLLTPLLAVIWVLLNNSFTLGQWLFGALLGWLIPLFALRFWPERVRVHRPLALARFILMLLYDILVANLAVAWLIVRGERAQHPGFVEVALALRSDLAISLLANTISLTPGTVSAWLSPDRRYLVVHGLDVRDPEALIATIKRRYEAPLVEIFEPC